MSDNDWKCSGCDSTSKPIEGGGLPAGWSRQRRVLACSCACMTKALDSVRKEHVKMALAMYAELGTRAGELPHAKVVATARKAEELLAWP